MSNIKKLILICFIGLMVVGCYKKKTIFFESECKYEQDSSLINTDGGKTIPQDIAIEKCNSLILSIVKQAKNVKAYYYDACPSFKVNETNASVFVSFDLKRINNTTEPFVAKCVFENDSWNEEISINPR